MKNMSIEQQNEYARKRKLEKEETQTAIASLRALYEYFPTSTVALIRSMNDSEQDRLLKLSKQLSDLCQQEINRRREK